MLARKPYSGPRKLVLAFDVGTTYSGISYCILQPGEIPDIRGVTKFPGQAEGRGNAKVPSILYYDANGNVKAIGNKALNANIINDAEDNGWTKAEWWKLHLRPKNLASAHIKDEDVPPLPSGKTAVDILTDFIKYLYMCSKEYIEEHHMGFNWTLIENSIEFVFSHPNGWEGLQQQKYREAIEGAGLIPRTPKGRSRVHLITEGEASLHYCVSSLPEESATTTPQAIVIIDAGGGTVDLSVYSVKFNPIVCKEAAPAECRLQGSVFVTRRAAGLLRGKLEGSPHASEEEMDDIIHKFDQTTKLTIRSADEPVYITIGGIRYNNPKFNIKRGALKLSGEEATSLFDESIKAIIDAFDQQRQVATTKITMAFLVGGMGTNDFVWTHLQSYFRSQGIKICRPDNDINKAVPNGAAIFHIDRVVKSRVARATYGVRYGPWVDESNAEHCRRKNQWQRSASGHYIVNGGFCPILRRGDQIDETKEIRHPFVFVRKSQTEFRDTQVEILSYRGKSLDPQWLDDDSSSFTNLCTIQGNLSQAANNSATKTGVSGEVYYQVDFDVVAFFGAAELTAQIAWKENVRHERNEMLATASADHARHEQDKIQVMSLSDVWTPRMASQYNEMIEERTPATIVYYDD